MADTLLDQQQIDQRLGQLHPDWSGAPDKLARAIEFATFLTAADFVSKLAPRCEELDHHPDLALKWRWVEIELATHSAGGVTDKDFALAAVIDEVATTLPLAGDA